MAKIYGQGKHPNSRKGSWKKAKCVIETEHLSSFKIEELVKEANNLWKN